MSVFEIVRGVEGDCLVLDDTRICGPKPWGGGRIIKHFETDGIYEVIGKDEHHKLLDENAKLRELCRRYGEYVSQDRCEGCVCKTRCNDGLIDECWQRGEIRDLARELAVEVDK